MVNRRPQLELVLSLLSLRPLLLAVPLLLSKAQISRLQCFQLGLLASGGVVLEHASHPCDRVCLLSIVVFFLLQSLFVCLVLLDLLLDPGPLLLGLEVHTVVVE